MNNYIELLKEELAEQFRGKANIETLICAVGKQLNDVYNFYEQLRTERNLNTSVGKQLDGVGDIVVLSRTEAREIAGGKDKKMALDDETYRNYLMYKVLENSSKCTYYELIKGINMLWKGKPIRYSEKAESPATIMLDFDAFPEMTEDNVKIPVIKSGGVGIKMTMKKKDSLCLYAGLTSRQYIKTSVGCNAPDEIKEVLFLVNDEDAVIADESNNWLIE